MDCNLHGSGLASQSQPENYEDLDILQPRGWLP